ncbi:MAG: BolA family transcriptional regulator [Alphaproteobacteria bacterium]|nr:BolA family transcriptional regulator [Alphaproteobacteria bacterium]
MSVAETLRLRLEAAFEPQALAILDESERHRGHAGHRPGGETHFRIRIVSSAFAGLSRLARQRRVHEVLAAEIAGGIHALSLELRTPEEAASA